MAHDYAYGSTSFTNIGFLIVQEDVDDDGRESVVEPKRKNAG
jgi:hypothetical protein